MKKLTNTIELLLLFFQEWSLEIDKSSEDLTVLTFDNRFETCTRHYSIRDNIVSFEVDEFENRITLFSDGKLRYHVNLSEEGCIIGDIYEGEDFVDTFACFDIND